MKVVLIILLWMTTGNTQGDNDECKEWRLPREVLPSHYDITLRLPNDSISAQFKGSVRININCIHETDTITLHSKFLNFSNEVVTVEPQNRPGKVLHAIRYASNEYDMIRFKFEYNLTEGSSFILNIAEFSGEIHVNDVRGLFKTYESYGGSTREAYCTFFQPTYARMVFPCFDEPNMKATFTVKIERPAHLRSYSNMPISKTIPTSHNRFLDVFQKSPKMSTYLLAVSVNDFSSYQNQSDRTNILVLEDEENKLDIPETYEVAKDALREMEDYTNIPYKLEKLDHLIMNEYEFLGMEHWGLIVYKRKMFRRGLESAVGRHQMFALIFHEIAHQWFGNLVTMEWWSYLWLNEAFANYFQYIIGNKVLPEWRFNDVFIIVDFHSALEYDDPSKGSMAFPLTNKKICHIQKNYKTLSGVAYRKGSSVLRMFQHILGTEENFKKALRMYLNNRMMSTAKPADFFHALDEVNSQLKRSHLPENISFEEVGTTWTTHAGVPLVTVLRDYDSGAIHVTQERFGISQITRLEARWWIPLTWTTASPREDEPLEGPQEWLYENKTIKLNIGAEDWLLINNNVTGYYRVNYDDENWSLLAAGLQTSRLKFPLANRVQILDDAVNLVLAGRLGIDIAFDVTQFLVNEDDPIVWISAEKNFKKLLNSQQMSQYSLFHYYGKKMYIRQLMTRAYDLIGESQRSTSPMHIAMKECVENFACDLFVISCYKDRYLTWMPWWITALI